MSHALRLAMVATLVFTLTGFGQAALAETIVSHTSPAETLPFFVTNIGQSFTTPDADQGWNNLRFNWFSNEDQGVATSPVASGFLFLLSQEYTGLPQDLSGATPGYIADTTSLDDQFYVFDPTVELNPNTQYFVYTYDLLAPGTADLSGSYVGGVGYTAGDFGAERFFMFSGINFNFDMTTSTTIPEPSTLTLLGLGGFALLSRRSR